MKHICFLIRQLNSGGAQRQLLTLAKGLSHTQRVTILSFYPGGEFWEEAQSLHGVTCIDLKKKGRYDILGFGWNLISTLRTLAPDVIYSLLPVPNLLTALYKLGGGKTRVVWGIRSGEWCLRAYQPSLRLAVWLEKKLVTVPDLVIANSHAGAELMLSYGVKPQRLHTIPNGIDCNYYCPDTDKGQAFRTKYSLSTSTLLVGLVGRLDPVKGHEVFLRAAQIILQHKDDVAFLCIGSGPQELRQIWERYAYDLGISHKLHWIEFQSDMRPVYNGLDLVVSASLSEGFPNVLAEACACGRVCIATDVGESRAILGRPELIVPPNEPETLASAIQAALAGDIHAPGRELRDRVKVLFAPELLVERTLSLLLNV